MSKKSVWNKGKHNGGAGSKLGSKTIAPIIKRSEVSTENNIEKIDIHNPVNIVKRMNRENWVERPPRK
ncbi:hypothetical protein [Cohnella sp.]|uniref:hypothetical protein n=1 Tax=Cohnella sp. TaxID=1883426 RepID=UPI0035643D84